MLSSGECVYLCVCDSVRPCCVCVYEGIWEFSVYACGLWYVFVYVCVLLHQCVDSVDWLWLALSDKWTPFSDRPNYSYNFRRGTMITRPLSYQCACTAEKCLLSCCARASYPACPLLERWNPSFFGCQVFLYWLVFFCNGPKLQSSHSSACISLDSCLDKWVRCKVTQTPTRSTSMARGLVYWNMHGRVLAVEQCNEQHQEAHFSQRIQNVGSGKTCQSCEAATHAAPSAAH